MTELIIISSVSLVCILAMVVVVRFMLAFCEYIQSQLKQRESEYLRLIRDLQNRLTAKDLSGYMTLKDVTEGPTETRFAPRDDSVEAEIAAQNAGVFK